MITIHGRNNTACTLTLWVILFLLSTVLAGCLPSPENNGNALSSCKSDDISCYELPADFPEQMEKITYNGEIYAVDQVITFRTPRACRPYPPEVPERPGTTMKVTIISAGGIPGTPIELETQGCMYGFNPESVCKQFSIATPDIRDFGDQLGSYIGEASNTSGSYNAYYLKGIDKNQAIAIEIELVRDSSPEIENCPWHIFCYLKYVRQ
ncbi:MAG: hypothetical protein R6U37_08705 [Dehalococcoidia bacterium]